MSKDERIINLTENFRIVVSKKDAWIERKNYNEKENKYTWKNITGYMTSFKALFKAAQFHNLLSEPKITKLKKMNDELIEAFEKFNDIVINECQLKLVERVVYEHEIVYERKGKKKLIQSEKIREKKELVTPERKEPKNKKVSKDPTVKKIKKSKIELF